MTTSESLAGQYIELYDFADRSLEVRSKGISLPYRVFSKDLRVSHTAIVENKRLGHALALVKAQHDLTARQCSIPPITEPSGQPMNTSGPMVAPTYGGHISLPSAPNQCRSIVGCPYIKPSLSDIPGILAIY